MAVAYAMVLSFIYKSITVKDLPKILLDSAKTTVIIVFLIGVSSIMSWIMAYTSIPDTIATAMLALTNSKIITLIIINIVLLLVGTFMDPTPAILSFYSDLYAYLRRFRHESDPFRNYACLQLVYRCDHTAGRNSIVYRM